MAVSDKGRKNKTRTTKKSVITKSSRKKPGRTLKSKTVIDKETGKQKSFKRKSTSSWANLKDKDKENVKTGAYKTLETGKVKETGRKFKEKRKFGPKSKSGGIRTSAGYARAPKKSVDVDKTVDAKTGVKTKETVKTNKRGKKKTIKKVTQPGGAFKRTVTVKKPNKPEKTRTMYVAGGNPVAPTEGPDTNNVPQSGTNVISPNASFNRRTASKSRTYTPVRRRR